MGSKYRWSQHEVDEIVEQIKKGYTVSQIAFQYDKSDVAIRKVIERFGYKMSEIRDEIKNMDINLNDSKKPKQSKNKHRSFNLELNKVYKCRCLYSKRKSKEVKEMLYLGRTGFNNTLLLFKNVNNNMIESFSIYVSKNEFEILEDKLC